MAAGIIRAFRIYHRAFCEVRAFWAGLGLILAMGLLWVPLSLLLPLPMKLIVDNVLGGQAPSGLAALVLPRSGDASAQLIAAIALSVGLGVLGLAYKLLDWLLRESVADGMVHGFRGRMLLH